MAILAIEGMNFYANHGYYKEERKKGGRYSVDVYINLPNSAGITDELSTTLNYEEVYAICKKVMDKPTYLIEHLANRILLNLRNDFPDIEKFKVRVRKHQPPLPGEVNSTYFEIDG